MNVENELKKLTITNRIIHFIYSRHPHAYLDISDYYHVNAWHNTRAMLLNRLEEATNYKWVVKFDKETHEALLLDRQEYLADHDRLYELYD